VIATLRNHLMKDERGVSISELLVAMVLFGIASSVLLSAAVQVFRASRVQSEDYDTLGALRNAGGFMEKELREGRRLRPGSTSQDLTIWVDHDRDYVEDDDEIIQYLISDEGGDGSLELRRTTEAGSTRILARYLQTGSHFEYFQGDIDLGYDNPSLADTSVIVIELTANSPGTDAPDRHIETEVRLRNAELD
jgi:type II secretory pathway pseudopilin PulG